MNIVYIVLIISILLFLSSFFLFKHTHKINEGIDHRNKLLEDKNEQLVKDCEKLTKEIENKHKELQSTEDRIENKQSLINDKQKQLNDLQDNIKKTTETQTELSRKAFENYVKVLEEQYKKEEQDYDELIEVLKESYSNLQLKLMREADQCRTDLDKIRASRAAAIEAQRKEKEISENKDDYRLNISETDKKDIRLLKSIQKDITNSIVIDKIIWSNYYQPLAKTKFPKIIGKSTACGIYKITNIETGEVYIGQSLDCCERWKQHCKNALGVGTVSSNKNKLYNSMKKFGLYNFTFELLEECSSKDLNEKEKYFISLYQAYNFGLNGNKGNGEIYKGVK